ncbi:uncharacterized protein [Drosophila kikkawai]|uniref:Uncharacterized protein n=1 Tax=Drosophila kikkawai TaxID=30033 RepID=A0A6P4J804_DROKI|nr:uncharacterized protein LOC108085530 [Drosophila kikkawai]
MAAGFDVHGGVCTSFKPSAAQVSLRMCRGWLMPKAVNISLYRKFSGYRPFLYNITVDFCDFYHHKARYPWLKIGHEALSKFSNLNHSCPYNHDIIVSGMILNDGMLQKTPFPTGSYMLQVIAGTPEWQGITQVMVDIVEV